MMQAPVKYLCRVICIKHFWKSDFIVPVVTAQEYDLLSGNYC